MMRYVTLIAMLVWGSSSHLYAQITVQQPVVRTTGVATSVSVPDRGSTFLGGVSSAESFRNSYGPLRTGTSRGYGLSGGSMSAHVHIIDLHAMDEAILNSVPDSLPPVSIRSRSASTDRYDEPRSVVSAVDKAANFERLAKLAEAAGRTGVAKLHWQMAAKYGSTVAVEKLALPAVDLSKATAKK